MILELSRGPDQTQFKEIFRAAPIRVPGALPLKLINVTGIIDKNVPNFWSVWADTNDGAAYRPNKLLNPVGSEYYRSTNTALPHWVKVYRGDFGLAAPARFGITPQTVNNAPADFQLHGSDDDTAWTLINSWSGLTAGWTSGEERLFDITSANWKYLRWTVSALVGAGNQLDLKGIGIYAHSATVLDDYHSEQHSKRLAVEDRVRMWLWQQLGRARQLRLDNDRLLGAGTDQITAHLQAVEIQDIEGLENPAYRLLFAYGYGE